MSVRRMLPFILINIVVSAAVVLAILYWWDARESEVQITATPTTVIVALPEVATAAADLQGTDTPEPDPGPLTHTVVAGQTLSNLSELYEVSMEDIMAANGITNPDVISVGQELVIPVGGLATPTSESSSAETEVVELPSPIATVAPLDTGEAIVEISGVTGVDNLQDESVQLTNSGSRQIALLDWKLADADGHVYTFGQITLFGDGAAIEIHTEPGVNGPADLYWGLSAPVWQSGERVTLLDADGNIQATYDIP